MVDRGSFEELFESVPRGLVNWIVRQSGGEVTFAENDPQGSIVTIRQPRPE